MSIMLDWNGVETLARTSPVITSPNEYFALSVCIFTLKYAPSLCTSLVFVPPMTAKGRGEGAVRAPNVSPPTRAGGKNVDWEVHERHRGKMAIAGDIVPSKVGEGLATSDRSISPKATMLAGTGQHVARCRGDTVFSVARQWPAQ